MSAAEQVPVSAQEAERLFGLLSREKALVLAVSGGPDSTALMMLAARWRRSLKKPPKLVAVTIDHGLRAASKAEAAAVRKLAQSLEIEHRILRWTGSKPKAGVPEAARNARYRLLAEAAHKAGAGHVLTAHTLDDQGETILIRLTRGSGVAGLAGMKWASIVPVANGRHVTLVRPLLGIPKSRLIATLKAAGIAYADDPSNRDPAFTRARLRATMPALAREGLSAERLALLGKRVGRIEAALSETLHAAFRLLAPAPWPPAGAIAVDADAFSRLPDEIALRMLGRLVGSIGREGPVELGKLESLYDGLVAAIGASWIASPPPARFRRSLAGAVVAVRDGQVLVERAPARRQTRQSGPNQRISALTKRKTHPVAGPGSR